MDHLESHLRVTDHPESRLAVTDHPESHLKLYCFGSS